MNFSAYISLFNKYLTTLNRRNGTDYTVSDPNKSVVLYSDEFKKFIKEKTNVNVDAVKVSDLLKMEYKDGKLVDKSQKTEALQDESLFYNLNAAQTEESEESDDNAIIDILNTFMEDEAFSGAFDLDNSGDISQEEMTSFFDKIKGLDNDSESISLDDILTASKAIQNGTFDQITESADAQNSVIPETADNTPQPSSTQSSGSSSGGGGNYSPGSSGSPVEQNNNPDNSGKSIEDMSEAELESQLQTVNQELSTAQEELGKYQTGTEPDSGEMDNAYTAYTEALGEDKKAELDEIKSKITAKEAEITNKTNEAITQQSVVASAQTHYDSAKNKRAALEAKLSSLDMNDPDQASMKSGLEAEISTAKANETAAEKELEKAKKELERINGEKTSLEGELETLNTEFQTKETEVTADDEQIKVLQEAYDSAKQAYDTKKAEGIKQAQSTVEAKTAEIASIKTQQQKLKDTQDIDTKYPTQPEYNEEFATALASAAENEANKEGTVGYCLRGVARTLKNFFEGKTALSSLGSAYMAKDKLENDEFLKKYFTKVDVKREDLTSLPKGCIVVWQPGGPTKAGKIHGHIAITLGNGKEASDHVQKQVVRDCEFSVYYPTGDVKEFLKA